LHDLSGLSSTQIAELIGISEGTARYHLSMARRRLKKILRLGSQKEGDGNES